MSRKTLLTFISHRDPFTHDAHDDGRHQGPALVVLNERKFDRVILFSRPHREEQLRRTQRALRELHPKLLIEIREVALTDSTYHPEILTGLREALRKIHQQDPHDDYTISLLGGTPEIHACWILIHAAGEFPARLVNYRRSVHNGLAGPRSLRELDWSQPLAAIRPETLTLLAGRRDRHDDSDPQDPASTVPRHYFARRSLDQAVFLSRHHTPVVIHGEPGTQKHYMAALIHQLSIRHEGPLVMFNCGTVPDQLFESAIFGEPGEEEASKLAQAGGGTLVLLKIQQVPGPVLIRLLTALDDGYYYNGKSRTPVRVNVRLMGTTDRDLEEEVRLGRLSLEAWRRLQVNPMRLPSLRERPGDSLLLAHDELARLNRTLPRPKRFAPAALARLESHTWPSNVSELRRVIEQAVLNAEQATIHAADIDIDLAVSLANVFTATTPRIRAGFSLPDYLRTVKHQLVRSALSKTGNNQSEAARLLGVTPQAVSKYLTEMPGRRER